MIRKTIIVGLIIGVVVSFSFFASAGKVIPDDLIVTGNSDGAVPEFDCSAPTLPFIIEDGKFVADPDAAIGTIPAGDPVIIPEPITFTCVVVDNVNFLFNCQFTCNEAGSAVCVGLDCADDESFDSDEVKLKENNLRIRFHDTSIGDVLGQSWNVEANSEQNNGLHYFGFQVKSVDDDELLFSDGTAPLYDCPGAEGATLPFFSSVGPPDPASAIGITPFGDPIIEPVPISNTCVFDVNFVVNCQYTCSQKEGYAVKPVLLLGTAGDNPSFHDGAAIGYQSAPEDGVISVGRAEIKRRIARVAAGVSGTDALTLEGMHIDGAEERIALLSQWIVEATAELDDIEAQIALLEGDPYDVNGDGSVDRDDVRLILTQRNQPAGVCPECDVNGDGMITVLDAMECIRNCSRPRCATE